MFWTVVHSSLRLAAAGFDFAQEFEGLLVNKLVAVHTWAQELHLQHVAKMTHLTSLTLRGGYPDATGSAGNCLTLLQSLAELHTLDLMGVRQAAAGFQQLHSLRELSLVRCKTDPCDLSSCTQITSLALTWSWSLPQRIMLPSSSNVQLQHLSISAAYKSELYQELQNLQDASQLTYLEFDSAYPANFDEGGWPAFLPCLTTVKLATEHALPQQLVDYSRLRHHDAVCYGKRYGQSLPFWLSQLTQLDTLRVFDPDADESFEFPVCLLQLMQLSSLRLPQNSYDELPVDIVQFSEFTALTVLDMGHVQSSSRAHQQLSSLNSLLAPGVLHWQSL